VLVGITFTGGGMSGIGLPSYSWKSVAKCFLCVCINHLKGRGVNWLHFAIHI